MRSFHNVFLVIVVISTAGAAAAQAAFATATATKPKPVPAGISSPTEKQVRSSESVPVKVSRAPLWVSLAAFLISATGFYFQWLHARGARVSLLNDGQDQNSAVRPYNRLPKNVQNDFPEFDVIHPGYALVRLLVLNTGDRPGYAKIAGASVTVPWANASAADPVRVSYYTYILVPPLAVVDKLIIVRNLPEISEPNTITVNLRLELGGPAGRFRGLRRELQTAALNVSLIPSRFDAPVGARL